MCKITVLLLLHVVLDIFAETVPPGIQFKCRYTYSVKTSSDHEITVHVRERRTACDSVEKQTAAARISPANTNLQTTIRPVYKDGEYRAIIKGDYLTSGTRLPQKFLLHLAFTDGTPQPAEFLGSRCFEFRLKGNRKVGKNEKIELHFDCLPLLDEPNIYLTAQIWSSPGSPLKNCRIRRSVPGLDRECDPGIECSRKYFFPLSKESHKYRQCACYPSYSGDPELKWNFNKESRAFNISISNLPPYMKHVKVDVVNNKTDKIISHVFLDVPDIKDGSLQVETTALSPGNYTPYVCCVKSKLYLECQEDDVGDKVYVDAQCHTDGSLFREYSSKSQEVKPAPSDEVVSGPVTPSLGIEYILGIVGGIAFTAIITGAVFMICHCRKQHSEQTALKLRSRRHHNTPRNHPDPEAIELQEIHHVPNNEQSSGIEDTEIQQDLAVYHPGAGVQRDQPQLNESPEGPETPAVLLLYHITSNEELTRAAELKCVLEKNGIDVLLVNHELLQGFPSALQDIVLIFTHQLYQHYHHFLHNEATAADPLLHAEGFNLTICHLLEKMGEMVKSQGHHHHHHHHHHCHHLEPEIISEQKSSKGSDWCNIHLHLVSFYSDNSTLFNLIQSFVNELDFLIPGVNFFPYYMIGGDLMTRENREVMNMLQARILKKR